VADAQPCVRCAIYTRKSTEEGLEQNFNSLHAQREAAEAYILSQRQASWTALADQYDDGGFTGGNLERPALKRLLRDIEARKIDCVVVYKVDRLSRSLLDFAQLMSMFDRLGVSFVSVTQDFNTTTSLGRLTLHILLSFAQFEREIISERTRDKMSAARRKGKWTGGIPILGYDVDPQGGRLVVNQGEATRVRQIFALAARSGSLAATVLAVNGAGLKTKEWTSKRGMHHAGRDFHKMSLRALLGNVLYTGSIIHKGKVYPGEHEAIINRRLWERVNHKLEMASRQQKGRRHNPQTAPLIGLLHCACGARMPPTYAVRHGRRYRYYVCEGAPHGSNGCRRRPRLAADDIETSLSRQLVAALGSRPGRGIADGVERVIYNAATRQVSVTLRDKKQLKYVLPVPVRPGVVVKETRRTEARLPRICKLMALAIRFQRLVRTGRSSTYADLARRGQVSRSRLSQILSLNNLAPTIQEALLFLPRITEGRDRVTENNLRRIAHTIDWRIQRRLFDALMSHPASTSAGRKQ